MFTFDTSIQVGNRVIDEEHKKLIAAINDMLAACVRGGAEQAADQAMRFMESYIETHFSHEEALQRQYGYPDYERHRQLHEGYKKTVRELGEEYRRVGATPVMLNKLSNSIGGWLINHIKREDVKLAAFLREERGVI